MTKWTDKALRGKHIDDAARRLGWLIQTGVYDVRDAQGNPTEWHIEDVNVERADGTVATLSVYGREGAAGLRELTETGEPFFVPLARIKTERRGRPVPLARGSRRSATAGFRSFQMELSCGKWRFPKLRRF